MSTVNLVCFLICFNLVFAQVKFDLGSANSGVIWIVENDNQSISIPASVPGGLYSDLQKAGVISDILHGSNDVLTRWVAYDSWTFKSKFQIKSEYLQYNASDLILEGVDTMSFLEVNGIPIGLTNNMFVKYIFDIRQYLKEGENELVVHFVSPVEAAKERSKNFFTAPQCVPQEYHGECHANQLRKMQASFSWDWGPAFPSVGLWKNVSIEFHNAALIRSITTHTQRTKSHWYLKIIAFLNGANNIRGYLSAKLSVDGNQSLTIGKHLNISSVGDGTEVELNMTISTNVVSLWWPNGYGEQPLYDLEISLTNEENELSQKKLKIGFRTVELVEVDASTILGNTTGGQGLTFFFKVNGYPLFMKGSNWIPAHILPEVGTDEKTVDNLLQSAREAHMAMLRVWGGGVYESDYFYQRCDELGILIWQDFLFACSMYPTDKEFLENVKLEIEQTVQRLQHHSSIAVWAGNNENEVALRGNWYQTQPDFDRYKEEYVKLYVETIKPIVETLDPDRRYLVSSPSNGRQSEKDGYVALNPYDPHYGDTHYYNYIADNWDANIYPQTRFASEYGFQSFPSLKTMAAATNTSDDFRLDSEFIKHRQHSPNGNSNIEVQLSKHLNLDKNDSKYFEKFVFYSQISQAMSMKAETEFYRQSQADWYTMGALYWQLNDVWQAPSWSGIEYGGKWKMLHFFAKRFFAPILVSPRLTLTGDVDVYLINDRFVPITDAEVVVDVFSWNSLAPILNQTYPVNAMPLSSTKQTKLNLWNNNRKDEVFIRFTLKGNGGLCSPQNFVFPVPLKDVKGLRIPTIKIKLQRTMQTADDETKYIVNIETDSIVLFLWLESEVEGHFSDNGLIVTDALTKIFFTTKTNTNKSVIQRGISYQYYIH